MAYLLQSPHAAHSCRSVGSDESASNGDSTPLSKLHNGARHLYRGFLTALHKEPARPTRPSKLPVSHDASNVASTTSIPTTNTMPATPARAATVVPSASTPVAEAPLLSKEEMHRRAVDYADVEEVLRCPLPGISSGPFYTHQFPHSSKGAATSAAVTEPNLIFRCIAADASTGIQIFSAPVPDCPMHLMRAHAIMPCLPSSLLQYMDNDIRPMWDNHIRRSALLEELHASTSPPMGDLHNSSRSLALGVRVRGTKHSPSSLSTIRFTNSTASPSLPSPSSPSLPFAFSTASPLPHAAPPAEVDLPFQYLPGQRRVAIHYLETKSPVPFIQDRDFELVVSEEVREDGSAYMKAFSTPLGYSMPLDPRQSRYVRGVVLLSGVVARPFVVSDSAGAALLPPSLQGLYRSGGGPLQCCTLEYIGLVHPMGMIPAVFVNVVISAQLTLMQKLQAFIATHPMERLRCSSSAALSTPSGGTGLLSTVQSTLASVTGTSDAAAIAAEKAQETKTNAAPVQATQARGRDSTSKLDGAASGSLTASTATAIPTIATISTTHTTAPSSVSRYSPNMWWRRKKVRTASKL